MWFHFSFPKNQKWFEFLLSNSTRQKKEVNIKETTLLSGIGLPGFVAMIALTMVVILWLSLPLHTKSKQGSLTKNFSSQAGIGGEIINSGSLMILSAVEDEKLVSIAFWMQKMRKIKKKDEKSCRNVALLLLHESSRFFLKSAQNCWYRRGKPLCKFIFFSLSLADGWESRCGFKKGAVIISRKTFLATEFEGITKLPLGLN